ncbi:MAG TPA: HD-GYP domain-containing protein [Epulopiscium sp.]|nr:HD-GYP domain-containing protein [Candidatus Epulonipiscium sp.]
MRFIPTFCLQEGMLLGKSIYNKNGSLLLREGSNIRQQYISKVIELDIQGLYVEDELSRGIEVESVINEELRLNTVEKIKDIFIDIQKESSNLSKNMSMANTYVEDMIEELINNKHVMVNMVDIKSFDEYTYHHSVNVCVLSIIIGISINLTQEELSSLGMAALLHDIGKVFINQELLNKVAPLTVEEFEVMKEHPMNGYKYMKSTFDFPFQTNLGVLQHHEKYDGTGYPQNKAGEEIFLFGRIIAIADVYDALVSNRYYKKALLPSEAMEYIMGGAGTHFDFELVNVFIRKVAAYPLGTCVKLSNGVEGIVVENYPDASTRPKIKLIEKDNKENNKEEHYINLKNDFDNTNLTIIEIINI